MKKTMNLIVALVLILGMISTVAAGAPPTSQVVELDGTPSPQPSPAVNLAPYTPINPDAILYDNGPLATHAAACSGMDASRLQTDLVMNTLGFGHQFPLGYRMADDFTITDPGGWTIDQITFFAYQTGAPSSPSPIVGVYYQIWDGPPDDAGSTVVFGDLTTNRFQKSESHNLQRDSVTSPCASNRFIFANVANAGTTLPPGTYWLDWSTEGSASYSGPWAPPVTILGQTTTGNALQFTTAWAPALDTGTATQQGMPFIIEGSVMGGGTLHLDKMKSFVRPYGTGRKFVQITWVHDQNMQLVEGARVWGEWTYPNGKILPSFLRLTNGTGFARFVLKTFMPGLYQFCVTDITLAGYTYDPLQNEVDPCVSFVAP